jgi:hypothetical protein
MADITDILKRAKARETTVTVCLAGDLAAEAERLEAELAAATQEAWGAPSLAAATPGPSQAIAKRIEAVRKKMAASEVVITLRALGYRAWSDLVAAHPSPKDDQAFDPETFSPALVAACAVDPAMTPEQASQLFEVLNQGQVKAVIDAAFEVNSEPTAVPFSVAASAILASRTDEK